MTTGEPHLKRELGLRDLTLFAIAVIVGPRWITVAAHAGPTSIVLWLMAAILLGAPLGVAVAALMRKYPGAGGIYLWTREDFGPFHGFLCFWVYWFSTAFTLPGVAMYAMSVSAYALGPHYAYLADSRAYVVTASLVSLAIALGTNLVGMRIGKWTENMGGITAWIIILLLIATAGFVWWKQGSVTPIHIWPDWNWDTLSLFGAIAFAISGMELIGMMGGEIRSPERTVVPATWIATAFVVAFYIAATISVLVLLPPEKVDIMRGLADSGNVAAAVIGWVWLAPLIAGLVLINSIGGLGGLGTSVSRMPYAAGVDSLLPKVFGRIHPRWGTPYVSILALAAVTALLLVVTQIGDTMRAAYQTILSLMVISGFIPYFYLFLSAWKCRHRISAVCGLAITAFAVVSSVVPTSDVTNVALFEAKILGGTVLIIGLAWLVYRRGTAALLK